MSEINSLDAFLLAVEIEEIGKEFYAKAAAHTKDISLKTMLTELSAMEEDHAALFRKMFTEKKQAQSLAGAEQGKKDTSPELTGYLQYLIDLDIFHNLIKNMPESPEDVLKAGIDAEKCAIIFYMEIKNMIHDSETHDMIGKILHQEKIHFMQLSEKLKNLRSHP